MVSRKKLTVGLFGFGCVGYGLYEVLEKTAGLKANIKWICVKDKNKSRQIPMNRFTFDADDILNDDEINTVVELIDDADAAFEIVKAALKKGKAVVTANKKMIADHFTELLQLQKQYDVPLLYEAACCASIPIIRNLEEYYDNDLLESIEGIVNGSTNYILTKTSD
jgi:homoserine dehydrogenase